MNQDIVNEIGVSLNIRNSQVGATLKLLSDGNTIPFIARYRKDVTGGLDEEVIKSINEVYIYQVNLLKRKEDVIRLIDEKGMMTTDLQEKIMSSMKLVEVEDLYRPYKEKKKTKATDAIAAGLEPLAKSMLEFPTMGSLDTLVSKYITDKIKTKEEAITGASYIIAEYISDNALYRKWARSFIYRNGIITTKEKKEHNDTKRIYEMYYGYSERINTIKPHRILAINRAEDSKVISVSIDVDSNEIFSYLESKVIIHENSYVTPIVVDAIKDSYKRLIFPSIEREIRSDLTDKANVAAIDNFSKNLEALLLQPPIKEKTVLGFDPGYTNGCKLAIIDKTGKYIYSTVIRPFASSNASLEQSKQIVTNLINQYNIDIVAIGNGTASRESETLIVDIIKTTNKKVEYIIVSEAGASIYSTELVAQEEFPDLSPNERSAVSIGRRLQDPLAELVKIPPEAIGVGLYQHDVPDKDLKDSLDFIVSKAVNSVGVNINTASASLLKYVSGITKKNIDKIIEYRNLKGKINSRKEIKSAKLLSDKVYEQAIGFLRVVDGENILDVTGIHPESYDVTLRLLSNLNMSLSDVGTKELTDKLSNIDILKLSQEINTDFYTLEDIVKSLVKPNRDPRDDMPKPLLKSDILKVEDLKVGMEIEGIVRNVVDFGAFIDIGLHNDGLVHISKITNRFIKHPSEVLSVGDIVTCYVIEANIEKEKVSLSLIRPEEKI